jgi:hypothetical protein
MSEAGDECDGFNKVVDIIPTQRVVGVYADPAFELTWAFDRRCNRRCVASISALLQS